MDNTNIDSVFLLPEEDKNINFYNEIESKKYQVVLYANELSEENRAQLEAILKAVSIDLNTQVHLITLQPNQDIRFTEMYPHSGFLFLFGVSPETVGFNILHRLYEVLTLHHTKVILSESIHAIRTQIDSKKRLWACLKSYFIDQ